MGIFDFIKDILYKKSGTLLDKSEEEHDFQPFMVQRWLSMHSNLNVKILNATTNKLYKGIDDKPAWYKLFITTLPKAKYKRFKYIKKVSSKKKKSDLDDAITMIAQNKQISKREVKEYIEEYGLDVTSLQKGLKKCQ